LDGWTIGASGSWSLFDGGESRGRRRAALAERRIAEVKLDDLELQIGSRLRELYQALAQTRKSVDAQESGRQFAARAFQVARRLYENGQTSLEKVLQAQMISRQAENRYLDAVFRYNATVAQIEQAIGGAATDQPAAWKP
jgi:outer membrane protein TolC